ncbi:hypothetical protein ACFOWE_30620 [Planomonospora corallina]|uniref:VWA domain-containing protein n=1 Tax=Planomonospora corallina TaxID=1806052 RepID=A0ABV8IEM5_9ACTN
MGSGIWSTDVYSATSRLRAATGASAFAHTDGGARTVHDELNPYGVAVRESRDSAEHPSSLAVAVLFDVTGSMGRVPRVLQTRLPDLLGLLLRKGYATDPQILFGAIGDATCDRAPLQVAQYESDNRMDEHLGRILLEGGGGGQLTESYELAMYFMARHTSIDCHEKRGRRGYLFIIGDELPYPEVKRREVAAVIGDRLERDIPTREIVAELTRMYDVYFILPAGTSHSRNRTVRETWRGLLGQNVLELDDLDALCETIALTVGLGEDAVGLEEGLDHLAEIGSTAGASVSRALAPLGRAPLATGGGPGGLLGPGDGPGEGGSGVIRL